MARGECNCGAVEFEIAVPISELYICHCSICRRHSGTNGMAVVVVPNGMFRWKRGKEHITTWRKPDADWEVNFCKICGSSLPGPNDDSTTYVPAGSIVQGDEKLKVAAHIWVDSKAAWDEIGDSGQRYGEAYKG